MQKSGKKVFSVLLAAVMTVSLLPAIALAEEPQEETVPEGTETYIETKESTVAEDGGEDIIPVETETPIEPEKPAVQERRGRAANSGDYIEWNGTEDMPVTGNGKIKLTAEAYMGGKEIAVDGDLTIDLNGQTLRAGSIKSQYARGYFRVGSGASLTVEDSSESGSGKVVGNSGVYLIQVAGGRAAITGGTWTGSQFLHITGGGTAAFTGGNVSYSYSVSMPPFRERPMILVEGTGSSFYVSNGTLESRGEQDLASTLQVQGGAVANITGGTVRNNGSLCSAIKVRENGTVNISGGTVQNTAYVGTGLYVVFEGRATVSGNAVIENVGKQGDAMFIRGGAGAQTPGGSVEMSGGTVTNNGESGAAVHIDRTSKAVKGGVLTLTGGTIENTEASTNAYAVSMQGTLNMQGGSIRQANVSLPAIVNTNTGSGKDIAEVAISGGEISAVAAIFDDTVTTIPPQISGGIFSHPVTEYVTEGKSAVRYTSGSGTVYAVGDSIGGVVEKAVEGDTVTVLKSGEALEVPDRVTVKNETEEEITVNGLKIEAKSEAVVHNFDTSWKYDAANHWRECAVCHDKVDKAAHTYKDGKCSVCGIADPNYVEDKNTSDEPAIKNVPVTKDVPATRNVPATKDDSSLTLWIMLLLLSCGGVISAGAYSRKRKISK